jgi:hypothetical protein
MKYQLPSNPSVYVDVVDDEDVSLMLEEWREASATAPAGTNPSRLHIFVQWCALCVAVVPDCLPYERSAQMRCGRSRPL